MVRIFDEEEEKGEGGNRRPQQRPFVKGRGPVGSIDVASVKRQAPPCYEGI